MCPHGYHHSGSMATPALGTRDVYIHTCKLYKLINLCWSTGCFMKCNFTKQPVDQHRLINLYNLHV